MKYYFLLLITASFLISCSNHRQRKPGPSGFSDDAFAEKLETIIPPVDTSNKKKLKSISANVRLVYQAADYEPVWVKENYAPSQAAEKLITELEELRWDGIDPERYNLTTIKKLTEKLKTKERTVDDAINFDTVLTYSYLAASRELLMGLIVPKTADSLWYHVNDTSWNAPRLLGNTNDGYVSLSEFRSKIPAYTVLRDAYKRYYTLTKDTALNQAIAAIQQVKTVNGVPNRIINTIIKAEMPWVPTTDAASPAAEVPQIKAYQENFGLNPTGKLDGNTLQMLATPPAALCQKIGANMERMRWMQRDFGDLYIVVDVPLMELFFSQSGKNVMHMNVVVGRSERQTPSLFAKMANIIINPSWGVPPTILKKDVLPGLEKSGESYMDKKGLKAYDKDGDVVDPSFIDESNYKNYTYKQAPGDDNSLGYIKFNLPNPWDIYLHDTPHREDFEKPDRALSSGCVRVQQPQEMAMFILATLEQKEYNQPKLDSMIQTHKTKWELLKNKIPVHIAYLTAYEDNTREHLRFARDIYQRDGKLIDMLKN
jgi:murein L,D-transpeptidase YcbB/YkuD